MTLGELRAELAQITHLPDTAHVVIDIESVFYGEITSISWDEEIPEDDEQCVWINSDKNSGEFY